MRNLSQEHWPHWSKWGAFTDLCTLRNTSCSKGPLTSRMRISNCLTFFFFLFSGNVLTPLPSTFQRQYRHPYLPALPSSLSILVTNDYELSWSLIVTKKSLIILIFGHLFIPNIIGGSTVFLILPGWLQSIIRGL